MSLIEGAQNPDEAKVFYDWVLTPEVQSIMPEAGSYQIPSNMNATPPEAAPDLASIKLIDYDFAEFGSSERREALLSRWDDEVGGVGVENVTITGPGVVNGAAGDFASAGLVAAIGMASYAALAFDGSEMVSPDETLNIAEAWADPLTYLPGEIAGPVSGFMKMLLAEGFLENAVRRGAPTRSLPADLEPLQRGFEAISET